jgi:hypothetical protein
VSDAGYVISIYCVLYDACSEAEERVFITETLCVHCDLRAEAEETIDLREYIPA